MRMVPVTCLETRKTYWFSDVTPYHAMVNMLYTLNLKHKDDSAVINKTDSGMHLWFEHNGKTYSTRIYGGV